MKKYAFKKVEEKEILDKFLHTDIGNLWYKEHSIIDIIPEESPDFLCKTGNKSVGVEVTQFFVKHKNRTYSQPLTRYGNQLCAKVKKEYNINISIIIDKYDGRKFSIKWRDHIDYLYNPGFSNFSQAKVFKDELENFLQENINTLKKQAYIQGWIQINDEYYLVSIQSFPSILSGKYDCQVNNSGEVKFNPFDELQDCINKKNETSSVYQKKIDKCFLLIAVPDAKIGNYCVFTDEINHHKFFSKFDSIFLYAQDTNNSYILNT